MPAKLRIPDRQTPSLAEFLQLAPSEVADLIQALRDEKPRIVIADLAEAIAARLSIDRKRVESIVALLADLEVVKEGGNLPAAEFTAELRAAMERSEKPELQAANWGAFQADMERALSDDSAVAISAKARNVMMDHAKVFCTGRVLTDLRPVFSSNVEQEPFAFLAIHSLKIAYHEDGKHGELFVAMDQGDVRQLISLLERALKKEKSLKDLTVEKGLKILEPNT